MEKVVKGGQIKVSNLSQSLKINHFSGKRMTIYVRYKEKCLFSTHVHILLQMKQTLTALSLHFIHNKWLHKQILPH